MAGYHVDEAAIREQALRLSCAEVGWPIELGRKWLQAFANAKVEERKRPLRPAY
jgi:hypothetical protein